MKKIHLICNAHLDPVWLWDYEEGMAEAMSTFRIAAEFCEKYDGFVFNHNESVLYEWVKEYEPALFARIQKLVKQGKWHIMGGWYLQPDCIMLSGESFYRQIQEGRRFFKEHFQKEPTTAMNFDPFGHSRGLVQILAKNGYDSYVFCRPFEEDLHLENDTFIWEGYDGSKILCQRAFEHYNSLKGEAIIKVHHFLEKYGALDGGLLLWGIGNHGGGPSHEDLKDLNELIRQNSNFCHSTPEAYFKEVNCEKLPVVRRSLTPWAIGCYTSQVRIKQTYCQLEHELYALEKMVCHAVACQLMEYPVEALKEAEKDLLFSQFHDILPGSSIAEVEKTALRRMEHGLEIISKLRIKAFFKLANGQPAAKENEIPILIYNPHPYKVKRIFECQFNLANQNWNEKTWTNAAVYSGQTRLSTQVEKESSNLTLDWIKKVVFEAELQPSSMNRFDCRLKLQEEKPVCEQKFSFSSEHLKVEINKETGLIDRYEAGGINFLEKGAMNPVIVAANEDPWVSAAQSYGTVIGAFHLMDEKEGSEFSGIFDREIPSVRVIEDGDVRTIVEAVFSYHHSFLTVHYLIPKCGTMLQIDLKVVWNEKNKALKYTIPTTFAQADYIGQDAFGIAQLSNDGKEMASHQWCAIKGMNSAFGVINRGIYGSSCQENEIALTLLNGAAYSCLELKGRELIRKDRAIPRIDQGEREFTIWADAGADLLTRIDKEAWIRNEQPVVLPYFPSGEGTLPQGFLELDNDTIQLSACYQEGKDYVLRFFETQGKTQCFHAAIESLGYRKLFEIKPYEIITVRVAPGDMR